VTPWLLVAGDFTPLGGMDVANLALARHLARRGDELHVVAHRVWADLSDWPGVNVHHAWRPFGRHLLGGPFLARKGRQVWRALRARGVRAVANGGNCALADANWVHYLHAAFVPPPAESPARRARQVLTRQRDVAAERHALQRARVVICNSERTRRQVVESHGLDEHRVHVVYYGTDADRLAAVSGELRQTLRATSGWPVDRPLIGFVGALGDRRKAFDTLYAAWLTLCRDPRWDADLVVAGTGAELPAWRARAAASGLGDRIRFLGFRRDVPEILSALDGLVHPARYEAYGLAVHEALCRGIPSIVSASAGIAERYPDELHPLLLADPDDPDELAERLRFWRSQMEPLKEAVLPFSAALRSWTWDAMASAIVNRIEQAGAA
jgi:glycosyltransferase involved in cell wall biosynthesis